MRTQGRFRLLFWAVGATVLLRGVAQAQTKPWWDERWTCRKTVQVSPVGEYGEDLAAAVAFTTGGYLQADADDLRIFDEAGQKVPYYVVASEFEDLCTVVFRSSGRSRYSTSTTATHGPRDRTTTGRPSVASCSRCAPWARAASTTGDRCAT